MRIAHLLAPLLLTLAGTAQAEPVKVGAMDAPCAAIAQQPGAVAAFFARAAAARAKGEAAPVPTAEELQLYNDWQKSLLVSDFSGRCRYQAENAALPPATKHRVIFFGDSITELWKLDSPDFFRNDILNRGISGQTTQQMLGRFRLDVIDLHPKLVHIIAGTNDIAGNTGPTSLAWVEANIETMVELAQTHGIKVVLGAVPPAATFKWHPEIASAETIIAYNKWLKGFAARKHIAFVDYHAALDDGNGGMRVELSGDGVHPNAAGYAIMMPLAQQSIASVRR